MPEHYPPDTWPDELRRLPITLHPDSRPLVNNNLLGPLFGVTHSAIRERRSQGKFPQSTWRDGNRHYTALQSVADAFLTEFPGKIIDPPPPVVTAPPGVPLAPVPLTEPGADVSGAGADMEASGVRQEQRQGVTPGQSADLERVISALDRLSLGAGNAADVLTESVNTTRALLLSMREIKYQTDAQVTALAETVARQARQLEEKDRELRAVREASERRHGFWAKLFQKPQKGV